MVKISTKLVKDGNSTAVRIPKTDLEMSGLKGDVTLNVKKDVIIIKYDKNPRRGWAVVASTCGNLVDKELGDWEGVTADAID